MKYLRAIIICLFFGVPLSAHSHSWYDKECCSDQDCAPVLRIDTHPEGDLMTTIHGTVLVRKTENYNKRPSKDDNYHVCQRPPGGFGFDYHDDHVGPYNRIICIYYPALY